MTYLTDIIARALALVDGIVSGWTTEPNLVEVDGRTLINVTLNDYGVDFAESIRNMMMSAVEFFNSLFSAMGSGNYP